MKQGNRSWEVLVCDNGSSDATRDIVRQWSQRHPAIRLVDASARRGPAAARNIGVSVSRGRLIAFCDADDIVADGWVDALEEALERHDFVAGRFELELLRSRSPFSVSWSPQLEELTRIPYLPGFVTAGAGNMAMKREVFESIGGFDESALTAEDDDLCLRAQLVGWTLTFVPQMVLHVRQRAGLRAVWHQALSYGTGARRLQHRYALVAQTFPSNPADATTSADRPAASRFRQVFAAFQPRQIPSRIANAVWRVAWQRGWNTAHLDDVVQLDPRKPIR